jgi:hypothetical protein
MKRGDETNEERMALLEAHRETALAQLQETEQNLELVEWKINYYRERLEQQ